MSAPPGRRPLLVALLFLGATSCATASRVPAAPAAPLLRQAAEPLQADTALGAGDAAQAAYADTPDGPTRRPLPGPAQPVSSDQPADSAPKEGNP